MKTKDYCGQMIRENCAALNNAILFNRSAEVRSIASRLALYVQDYLTATEEEGGAE